MPTRPLSPPGSQQPPPSLIVANAVELFTREFSFDPQAHKEWREWKDVSEFGFYVHFRVETDRILGRTWRLSITEGDPIQIGDPPNKPRPRILLYVKNDRNDPGVRYYKNYNPREDIRIVTILTTVSLVWDKSPSGVQFTL